jgi:hypothetical protein
LGELAEFTGYSPTLWSKAFTRFGLRAHPVTHRSITHKNWRRYALTHERVFSIVDTPEKTYWLGFLWADGHPTRSGLRTFVARRDGAHLKRLREFLGSGAPITSVPISPIGGTPQQGLDVHSAALVKDLRALGLVSGRSEQNLPLPEIPRSLRPDLFRGLVDGDGSIRRDRRYHFHLSGWRITLAGSEAVTSAFAAFLTHLIGRHFYIVKNGLNPANRQLVVNGPAAVLVYGALYSPPGALGPALTRKAAVARVVVAHFELATRLGLRIALRGERLVFVNTALVEPLRANLVRDLRKIVDAAQWRLWFH